MIQNGIIFQTTLIMRGSSTAKYWLIFRINKTKKLYNTNRVNIIYTLNYSINSAVSVLVVNCVCFNRSRNILPKDALKSLIVT